MRKTIVKKFRSFVTLSMLAFGILGIVVTTDASSVGAVDEHETDEESDTDDEAKADDEPVVPPVDNSGEFVGELEVPGTGVPVNTEDAASVPADTNPEPPMCIDSPVSEMESSGAPGSSAYTGVAKWVDENERPEPDAYLVNVMCRDPAVDCDNDCVYDQPSGEGAQWRYPGDDPVTTAADLVAILRAELEDNLPAPVVAMNPVGDRAAIVNVPMFVHVENWTGTYETEDACAEENASFCISAIAEPRMIFDPGEPGVAPIECEGPGQPYDRSHQAGDDAFMQAGWDETCTHIYTTATEGDTTYEASVTVVWDITWTPEETVGTPTVELTTEIPKNVNEVHSVVTD